MAPLGLLLNQAKDAFARGIAEKASTDLLVEELTGVATLIARSFSTTGIDGSDPITKHHGADTTTQGVIIGVDNALERNRGSIRWHCSEQTVSRLTVDHD